jgi:hypothetical protein
MRTATPFAAKTSMAVARAGSLRAWVSMPRKSGPSMPLAERYSHTAWVTARMWSSLKLASKDEPLWPEVPKAMAQAGSSGSGLVRKYWATRRGTLTRISRGAGFPASSCIGMVLLRG